MKKRILILTLCLLVIGAAAFAATQKEKPTKGAQHSSGLRGQALQGPISPVEREGQPNTKPLPGAIITVQPAGGGDEIGRTTADNEGRFQLTLKPGTYLLVPLAPNPSAILPRGETQSVTVRKKKFTTVVVNYDTGIR